MRLWLGNVVFYKEQNTASYKVVCTFLSLFCPESPLCLNFALWLVFVC